MTCYGITGNADWCQEVYETASKDAGRRARELRKLGYDVRVGGLGWQVTRVGRVKMTLVHILPGENADLCGLPEVELVRL